MDEHIFMGRSLVHFPLWKVVKKGGLVSLTLWEGVSLMRSAEEVMLTNSIYEGDLSVSKPKRINTNK